MNSTARNSSTRRQSRLTGSPARFIKVTRNHERLEAMRHATHLFPEGVPEAHGLYDPRHEHDACGIGLIANIHNLKSHKIITDGLSILKNLEHRGAVGADPKAGDGAGVLLQIPHAFFTAEAQRLGFSLPSPQHYGVGYLFMPRAPIYRQDVECIRWETAREE